MLGNESMPNSLVYMYMELEQAVQDLSSRGLHQAAHWASEQLNGLDPGILDHAVAAAAAGTAQPIQVDPQDRHPRYMLARQLFEFKEYRRAAFVLTGVEGPKALFLRCYALYLAGEKRREEERAEHGVGIGEGPSAGSRSHVGAGGFYVGRGPEAQAVLNQELDGIESELQAPVTAGSADAFCLYLLGVVLLDKQRTEEARSLLLLSLHKYPCNWSAWMALQRLVTDAATLRALPNAHGRQGMPQHWSSDFFLASACLELQENMEALSKLQRLSHVFPQSQAVEALVAQAHYNLQNFDDAQALYEDLMARDPYRLEGLDVYSNILFVKEAAAPLSALAHRAVSTDKYRAETCAVVGNYYSLKGTHGKAVQYFKRALRLNRGYLAAWTLLGHEYMEAKNTPAAIGAYRAAVDLGAHDFRAWYGLGQAYELLKMPYYALYYYRRAASLRPRDARMWCALGQCYMSEQVGAHEMAIRCYQRAIEHHDPDGIALHMLAKLYEVRHEYDPAEHLYRANLARLEREAAGGEGAANSIQTAMALASGPSGIGAKGVEEVGETRIGKGPLVMGADAVEALLFLAGRCKDTNRLDEASAICVQLLDLVGGVPKERAKALAREVAALQLQQQQVSSNQQRQQIDYMGGGETGPMLYSQQLQQRVFDVPTPSSSSAAALLAGAQGLVTYQSAPHEAQGGAHQTTHTHRNVHARTPSNPLNASFLTAAPAEGSSSSAYDFSNTLQGACAPASIADGAPSHFVDGADGAPSFFRMEAGLGGAPLNLVDGDHGLTLGTADFEQVLSEGAGGQSGMGAWQRPAAADPSAVGDGANVRPPSCPGLVLPSGGPVGASPCAGQKKQCPPEPESVTPHTASSMGSGMQECTSSDDSEHREEADDD